MIEIVGDLTSKLISDTWDADACFLATYSLLTEIFTGLLLTE